MVFSTTGIIYVPKKKFFHQTKWWSQNYDMRWLSAFGKTQLAVLNGSQNSNSYIDTLEGTLLPYATDNHENNWVLQQDNAPIHTSKFTKGWIFANSIETLDWPAKPPDLNPIENL